MNDKAVYRTAPATPGLLTRVEIAGKIKCPPQKNSLTEMIEAFNDIKINRLEEN